MIINADDFGYSSAVNQAVLQAFDDGLVSSATIMANMSAFEEACALAHERHLLAHVGAHIVLSEGEPLSERIKRCRRFCDAMGRFSRSGGRALWLSRVERDAVSAELRAQIERCRREGLPVTHLDSHHHVHNEPAIGAIVTGLARELGVPYVRLARNCGPGMTVPRRLYKRYVNRQVALAGLARTRYFGSVEDYVYVKRHGASRAELDDFEVMTHPIFDDCGGLVEGLAPNLSLHGLVTKLDGHRSAVSYAGVSYA
jgi:predicted glycoside hydrolase/deacetylase ChbG (UPF0249 family)